MIVNKRKFNKGALQTNLHSGEVHINVKEINLYQEHPKNIITLTEFNQIALHRL